MWISVDAFCAMVGFEPQTFHNVWRHRIPDFATRKERGKLLIFAPVAVQVVIDHRLENSGAEPPYASELAGQLFLHAVRRMFEEEPGTALANMRKTLDGIERGGG